MDPASASRNEASARRNAKIMARDEMSHSLRGTMVIYVTWEVPLPELELDRDAMGTRCPHHKTLKCLPSVDEAQLG